MLTNLIEKIKFNGKYGKSPTVEQFIHEWLKAPKNHFYGYHDQKLDWSTVVYGLAPMEGLPDTHGYSTLPDIRCQYKDSLNIGNIEGISMHSGGVVRIQHFALNSELTRNQIGERFLNCIIEFFKSKNAIIIEFHENHSSKIEHYRRFFKKLGIAEIRNRVWQLELYTENEIPKHVLSYHEKLRQK